MYVKFSTNRSKRPEEREPVLNRLDYGNATVAGIPAYLLLHLQSVMNAAPKLIAGLPRSAYVSTLLASLHWL